MLRWNFAIFLMSFSKPQASFSSSFTSLFSVMEDNFAVLFQVKHYLLCAKGTNQKGNSKNFESSSQNSANSCHFWNNKLLFFFTKFASLASVMRHNSSILFLDEILCSFNKRSLSKYIFGEISREQSKIWNFAFWWVPVVQII